MSRRRGFTLLEIMVASAIFLGVLVVAWAVLSGGIRSFFVGSSLNSAVQDAQVFVEMLDHDLARMMVNTDIAEQPVWISPDGRELAFWVPALEPSEVPLGDPVPGRILRYGLERIEGTEGFRPVRDGVPLRRLAVHGWRFRHEAVDGATRGMQFLTVEVEVAGLFGLRTYPLVRRVALPQAAGAARYRSNFTFADGWVALEGELGPVEPSEDDDGDEGEEAADA